MRVMEPRFKTRLDELRQDARIPAGLATDLPQRLAGFLDPFSSLLCRQEQRDNAIAYVRGLLSGLERKNAEAISCLHGQRPRASCRQTTFWGCSSTVRYSRTPAVRYSSSLIPRSRE